MNPLSKPTPNHVMFLMATWCQFRGPKAACPKTYCLLKHGNFQGPPGTACFDAQVRRHPKPTTHQNMSSFGGQPSTSFDSEAI